MMKFQKVVGLGLLVFLMASSLTWAQDSGLDQLIGIEESLQAEPGSEIKLIPFQVQEDGKIRIIPSSAATQKAGPSSQESEFLGIATLQVRLSSLTLLSGAIGVIIGSINHQNESIDLKGLLIEGEVGLGGAKAAVGVENLSAWFGSVGGGVHAIYFHSFNDHLGAKDGGNYLGGEIEGRLTIFSAALGAVRRMSKDSSLVKSFVFIQLGFGI